MLDLQTFLDENYSKDEHIILACSAGPDSMFLLYELLKTSYKDKIVACYFNHKLRSQADREEEFLLDLWEKLGFKVEVASADIKKIRDSLYPSISLEELAREKRYMFFSVICQEYDTKKLITWHHLDDKIETFLFNLARGSKLTGFINMKKNNWNVLRPLLDLEKSQIQKYLDENNLAYFVDETNFDNTITRNHLRNEIIPAFYRVNDKFKTNIANTLNYFEELKDFIDEEVKAFLLEEKYFSLNEFNKKTKFLQKEIIRYIYFISNWNSTIWLSEADIWEVLKFLNSKGNKTKKEIKDLKMFKDWDKIYY